MSTPSVPLLRNEMDTVASRLLVTFLHHYHTQDQLLAHTTTVLAAGSKTRTGFLNGTLIKLRGLPALSFLFCTVPKTENSDYSPRFTRTTTF